MRVERLPFTVYDVVGYFFPGALFVAFFIYAVHPSSAAVLSFIVEKGGQSAFVGISIGAIFVLVSYTAGHIIAYVSSETVEKIVILFVSYPSEFLAREGHYASKAAGRSSYSTQEMRCIIANNFSKKFSENKFYCLVLIISFMPHILMLSLLSFVAGMRHIIKPLEIAAMNLVDAVFLKEFGRERGPLKGREWFMLVEYYVIGNHESASSRMYNYLTIYGFCRNIALSTYLGCLGMLWRWYHFGATKHSVLVGGVCLIVSLLMLLSFLKFFRRYSQEALISFAVMKSEQK